MQFFCKKKCSDCRFYMYAMAIPFVSIFNDFIPIQLLHQTFTFVSIFSFPGSPNTRSSIRTNASQGLRARALGRRRAPGPSTSRMVNDQRLYSLVSHRRRRAQLPTLDRRQRPQVVQKVLELPGPINPRGGLRKCR